MQYLILTRFHTVWVANPQKEANIRTRSVCLLSGVSPFGQRYYTERLAGHSYLVTNELYNHSAKLCPKTKSRNRIQSNEQSLRKVRKFEWYAAKEETRNASVMTLLGLQVLLALTARCWCATNNSTSITHFLSVFRFVFFSLSFFSFYHCSPFCFVFVVVASL